MRINLPVLLLISKGMAERGGISAYPFVLSVDFSGLFVVKRSGTRLEISLFLSEVFALFSYPNMLRWGERVEQMLLLSLLFPFLTLSASSPVASLNLVQNNIKNLGLHSS